MRIAREQGLEAVTMRAIAADLGVTPMALYYHVENKDELVGLINQAVLEHSVPLELRDDGWELALHDHVVSLWDKLAEYPGLAGYMIALPTLGTSASGYSRGVHFFEAAGFSPRVAQLAWSLVLTFLHGRLSVDARLDRGAARAAGFHGIKAREHVDFGLQVLILGLREVLENPAAAEPAATRGT